MEMILKELPKFIIVFVRFSAFIGMVPFFKNKAYSMTVKVSFAFLISILVFPALSFQGWVIPQDMLGFAILIAGEILVGVMMGFVLLILLFALELIGHMVGFQMAFSMARAVSPTGSQTNVMGVILLMTGTTLLLALGGDHYLLYSLKDSFSEIPPGHIIVTRSLIREFSQMIVNSFTIGFKMASPAVVVLLSIDITLGIIGKTASKMQIFFVGLPLKISLGLFLVTIILGFVRVMWGNNISILPDTLNNLFKLMRI